MSACFTFTCSHCGFVVDAWDDGNKYVQDVRGERHYYYHPAHHGPDTFVAELLSKGIQPALEAVDGMKEVFREFQTRWGRELLLHPTSAEWLREQVGALMQQGVRFVSGREDDYLCMNCGEECRRDPWRDPVVCDKCGQRKLRLKMRLLGRLCPKCKQGRLEGGKMTAIS